MSFDLFVLMNKTNEATQQQWSDNLKQNGVDIKFPEGFVIGINEGRDITVQCRLNPPLVKEPTNFEDYEFNFDTSELSKAEIAELSESTKDAELKKKINTMTSELQLYSQAGREDRALIVQCYAAASLANACDGVLFDPQEFGAVQGDEAYEVVKNHCQYEIDEGLKEKTTKSNSHQSSVHPKHSQAETNKPSKKGTSIFLLILFFIAVKNFLMK